MPLDNGVFKDSIVDHEMMAIANARLVLQTVRRSQPTYRAAVAKKTQLKRPTVTKIVNGLIDKGYLQEITCVSDENTRIGRPPKLLQVNANWGHILAIDLEPDHIRVGLTNLLLGMLSYRERLIDRFSEPMIVLKQIFQLCSEVLSDSHGLDSLGVGVSLPGLIDREEGMLISSTNMPKWKNVPVKKILEKELNLPVTVDRSFYLAALHESWINPIIQRDYTTLLISLRTGIGMSVIQNGRIHTGSSGLDGEIGHTVIDINGQACECGNQGCLETFVSASSICQRVNTLINKGGCRALKKIIDQGDPITPELVYQLAREKDPDCIAIVKDIGSYIGIAISNMVNLFAANEVIISGAIDTALETMIESIKEQVFRRILSRYKDNLIIRLAEAKEKAPLMGAAVLVARNIFEMPGVKDHPRINLAV